jgi:hypothetical protein
MGLGVYFDDGGFDYPRRLTLSIRRPHVPKQRLSPNMLAGSSERASSETYTIVYAPPRGIDPVVDSRDPLR